jgi:hypothetical protein
MTPVHRRRVRLLAAGVVGAFLCQLAYVALAEEPFPALMMPRFAWAGPTHVEEITIVRPEIVFSYADGKRVVSTQAELLRPVPDGHHYGIMLNLLAPLSATSATSAADDAPRGKLRPPAWLFPGYHLASGSRSTPEHVRSLRSWLRRRALALHSEAKPTRCVVTWYAETHRTGELAGPSAAVAKLERTGQFELDLR